ncbi:MAG TPA: hypothetical protein VFK02_24265 [Kofleriaceae bacterium]|nr:hypothetical protein [Kofleriaceae bacterium]
MIATWGAAPAAIPTVDVAARSVEPAVVVARAVRAAPDADPIAVVFLDDAAANPTPAPADTAVGARIVASAAPSAPRAASASGGARSAPGTPGEAQIAAARAGQPSELPGRAPGDGGGWMKMRGPARPDLGMRDGFVSNFLARDVERETVHRSGRLAPSGGTAVIHDRVTTVTVDRDGTAHFHDKPDVDIHWDIHLPTPGEIVRELRQSGREIATWYEDPYKLARVGPSQDVPRHMAALPGACDHWGDACSVELRNRDRPENEDAPTQGSMLPIMHGKLDVTSLLMRMFGDDPYRARKLALLDATRAERAELGARHAKEDLARSAEIMLHNLEVLWRATDDPALRREALFLMWDECGEGEGPIGEAGERARRMVIGWIRGKLPPGSPGAFTADDIARLSARRASKQPFVPYE